jgi:hypothetical protein
MLGLLDFESSRARPGPNLCRAPHAVPCRNPDHVRIQLDWHRSPVEEDADDRSLRGSGDDHATESGKRTEVDRDYCAPGHFRRIQLTVADKGLRIGREALLILGFS